ncbi:MAG: UDP-N-acetylmuramate--L-alanine ligase [Parcubacteria group bacterium CG1_02_37_51]|uniref:UDP-N-acetylmuramate--L-alanine ligase n=2 Tax=Candidatus Komeiliibacteriota TaxID=1817908 RepID=A0A2M8DQI9_9BACT|nr:MAG: UDP-N-acetylmuramate--L-alanine ligase [Parcubacteria group bacterium CG1_02_37_51]PIY95350.1 MAG: UDP-N-acetylmuramate--L-alanine ligase [Candidatus Komeilibacteria bacterium CG_4_10_14_0_8_um_filter_37_78]PJC01348.1 MAG: UDP-N-acetylmuramate--L-alanine ligase [Candidatus Komeilibacteria bacterium CG_4_9_14_0_8_um_filter_36_9]
MKLTKYKNVYFAGIGGIGVSALARLFFHRGIKVSGSDIVGSSIIKDLEEMGIKINLQQEEKNITPEIDLFIYSPACSFDNKEMIKAQALKIPTFSYPQFLGELSKQYHTIAISGTHGKSTTTAMTGLIFVEANLDPTVIVGSQVDTFDHNLKVGQSDYLIVEACEYRGHMLELSPKFIALTNLELDHLDYYKDIVDIKEHFSRFIEKTKIVALNIDNDHLASLARRVDITFGINNQLALIQARNITIQNNQQFFDCYIAGDLQGTVSLQIPGLFNVYNTLASIAIAHYYNIGFDKMQNALAAYHGCWRRFEIVGNFKKALIISDYAHHPTAVQATIKAAREFYPDKRIVVAFQPHQQNRTKTLRQQFISSFQGADLVILSEVYEVDGRNDEQTISAQELIPDIIRKSKIDQQNIFYAADLIETKVLLLQNIKPNDLVLIMGAGNIDNIARSLIKDE